MGRAGPSSTGRGLVDGPPGAANCNHASARKPTPGSRHRGPSHLGGCIMRWTAKLSVSLVALAALGLVAGGYLAAGEKGKVKVGDKAPAFEAKDEQGKTWKSADHVGKKVV